MIRVVSILLVFLSFVQLHAQETAPLVLGEQRKIASKILHETRIINIYLPEDYQETDTSHYPVIYILDGGMEEDFIHLVGLVRFNTQPWIARFPKSIVVGIENTKRRRDFTFEVNSLDFLNEMDISPEQFKDYGGSASYISFLEQELKPSIDSIYRTSGENTVVGESLGGLLATEILLKHTELFTNYIISSPSLWWGNESLLLTAENSTLNGVNVYIGACQKKEEPRMFTDAKKLAKILKKKSASSSRIFFDYLPEELHSTVLHQAVYNAFKRFYPKTVMEK
jgi:predicted alpha/beta superfamily hydrolase